MKLTKRIIEALEITGKRYEVRDDDLTGFLVHVTASGKKVFYYRYRAGKGRAAQAQSILIGSFPALSVDQAREIARTKVVAVAQGKDPASQVREDKIAPFVSSTLEAFLTQHVDAKLKAATAKHYRLLANNAVIPAIGKLKIEAVTHRHIASLHHSMKATPYMANRCIALLSKFFSWCELHGYRDKNTNPVHGLEKFHEEKRMKFMGSAELEALGNGFAKLEATDKIDPIIAAALKVLLFTGARCSEILTLEWSFLDLEKGIANLPDSKTGAKPIHIPPPAMAIIENLPRVNKFCFPGRSGNNHIVNVKDTWKRLLEASGLEGWRIHDLRHAFASAAASSGKSLPIIGKILGHTQAATTSRYAHLSDNPVATAAAETAEQLHKALTRAATGSKVLPFRRASNG